MSMSMSMMMVGQGITGRLFTNSSSSNLGTYKVSQSGVSELFGTTGLARTGWGIAFDGTYMWYPDGSHGKIWKMDPSGTFTEVASGLGSNLTGIAFDGTNMWISSYNNAIHKVTPGGSVTTYTGGLTNLDGIAFDGTNMWAAGYGQLVRITPSGTITTFSAPWDDCDICFDGTNLCISSLNVATMFKATLSGTITGFAAIGTSTGICFDGTYVWIKHYYGGFFRVNSSGGVTSYASATWSLQKNKICFDGTYVWHVHNSTIERINTSTGVVDTYSSTGTGLSTIAFDGALLSHWWGGS